MREVASKHHMPSIFIACRDIRYPSYVSMIHSKATWQGYTGSASHVVTYLRQVTFRSYGSKLHISKLHIKATWQCYLALLLSNVLRNATWHCYLAKYLALVLSNVLRNATWHLYLAKYLAMVLGTCT